MEGRDDENKSNASIKKNITRKRIIRAQCGFRHWILLRSIPLPAIFLWKGETMKINPTLL
ncbi:hypothetical protein NQ317_008840 [Molorchus minor]|uniref:Uncharacterized protein n=1 Tax=Molorchus minor TaxID=1323400 RepID=A0ABQ9IPL1_9CUCU|nr:hypothetical protein NQ317_008840 [Molorchus minor]